MLNRVADLLESGGEIFYRTRAYGGGARQLDNRTPEIEDLIKEGRLKEIPATGEAMEKKMVEYATTGQLESLPRLEAVVPPALLEITRVPGLGPRTAKDIYDTLGVLSLDALEDAARTHRLLAVRGIKAKTEENILKGIAMLKRTEGRIYFPEAWILADSMLTTLRALKGVARAEIAGSARRACETVGDLDLLVAADNPDALRAELGRLPQVNEVIAQDGGTTSIRVRSGMQVDLRVVKPDGFGAAWVTFTGSEAHNLQLRARAERMGKAIAGATEEEGYAALGCAWIPPELREGRGAIGQAARGTLPNLVQRADLRGDLHTHSNWSDGRNEIAEMARAAKERGYDYIVLTDHTQSLQIAQGLTPERFRARAAEIATVNARPGLARVLNGAEVDILPDGSLDLPDETLASLDLVVASVHVALDQPKDVITQRVLTALRSPHVDVYAHPTSRRLDRRGETSLDVEAVIAEAVKTGTALEINNSPFRLDLNDTWARKAREAGALLAIDNDAHYPAEYDYVRYGLAIGRRAGLTPDRVLNTRDPEGVLAFCREKAARAVGNLR